MSSEVLGTLFAGLYVLVLACHDDDFVLGCGCTIQWLMDVGAKVYVAVLSEQGQQRASQAVAAASRLNLPLTNLFLGRRIPDGQFPEKRPVLKETLVSLRDLRPWSVVFCHGVGDAHLDHDTLGREVRQVFRDLFALLFYSIPKPVAENWFRPTLFVDAEPYLKRTLQALTECFPTEKGKMYCDYGALKGRRREWGQQAGMEYAEAFAWDRAIIGLPGRQRKPHNGRRRLVLMEEGSPERPVWSVPVTDENEDTCQKFVIQLTGFVRADELQVQYQRQYLRQAA